MPHIRMCIKRMHARLARGSSSAVAEIEHCLIVSTAEAENKHDNPHAVLIGL